MRAGYSRWLIESASCSRPRTPDRSLDKVFEALSSTTRRKILSVLENAGLIRSERRGQFIHYSLVRESLTNTLNGYLQEVCPVSRPLKRESVKIGQKKAAS